MPLDKFLQGYIACALWSSNDDGGEPLDSYDNDDIAAPCMAQMVADCASFQTEHAALLERAYAKPEYDAETERYDKPDYDESRAGHDFWLTRNGHGAGFWDRGLGEVGDKLTAAAKSFSEVDLYVGDDSKIHA